MADNVAVSLKAIEATAREVVQDIELVLTDAEAFEGVLPPQVRTILIEAQTVLGVIQKILADI